MLKLIKKHLKNEKGLTLIELLVVIVILGIIAAIAVVSIGGIIGETEDKATVTEAVQIINAAKLAHASEGMPEGGWASTAANDNDLNDYISNLDDVTWTVTITDGVYSINGHDAEDIDDDRIVLTNEALTEETLTDFIDGEEPPAGE